MAASPGGIALIKTFLLILDLRFSTDEIPLEALSIAWYVTVAMSTATTTMSAFWLSINDSLISFVNSVQMFDRREGSQYLLRFWYVYP